MLRFLRGTLPTRALGRCDKGVCPRQSSKRAYVDKSQIKLESLILAQNERWRQA